VLGNPIHCVDLGVIKQRYKARSDWQELDNVSSDMMVLDLFQYYFNFSSINDEITPPSAEFVV
jgi:hypothetical protein